MDIKITFLLFCELYVIINKTFKKNVEKFIFRKSPELCKTNDQCPHIPVSLSLNFVGYFAKKMAKQGLQNSFSH